VKEEKVMAQYLLVHGAWGGGAIWLDTARRLRLAGHEVHVAAMAGLGERKHELHPGITLSDHIADVVATIDERGMKDIILVGHSYGGMVITGVAQQRTDQITAMVYVDAFLPRDGESLWDIADEPSRKHYIDAQRDAPGLVAPFPGSPRTLGRHPILTLIEPLKMADARTSIKRKTYVYATRGAPTVFSKFYERVKADSSWRVHSINTGHGVMVDDPDGMAVLLLAEAR
jgi:pimeloyl-ACP methyl ester carboxylesterase